jgi:hypothetical protein
VPDLLDTLARAVADVQTIAREGVAQLRNELNAVKIENELLKAAAWLGVSPLLDVARTTPGIGPLVSGNRYVLDDGTYAGSAYVPSRCELVSRSRPTLGTLPACRIDGSGDGYGLVLDGVNHVAIRGIAFVNSGDQGIRANPAGADDVLISDCAFPARPGQYGIWVRGKRWTIRNVQALNMAGNDTLLRTDDGTEDLAMDGLCLTRIDDGNPCLRLQRCRRFVLRNSVLRMASGGNALTCSQVPAANETTHPCTDGLIEGFTVDGRFLFYPGSRDLTVRQTLFDASTPIANAVEAMDGAANIHMDHCGVIGAALPIRGAVTASNCLCTCDPKGLPGWTQADAAKIREAVTGAPLMAQLRTLGVEA